MRESTNKVEGAIAACGLTSEASSRLGKEVVHYEAQSEMLQAQMWAAAGERQEKMDDRPGDNGNFCRSSEV